jgi:F-type H+-transporting ATPase subunit gamma
MTRRREVERHRRSLGEIREIMSSMKTLAYLETRKLHGFLSAQQAVVENVAEVAADFLAFFPSALPAEGATTPAYLLIGSERGFCGDFNHALMRELEHGPQPSSTPEPVLLPVGHKLAVLLEDDTRVAATLPGAGVVEEVADTLARLVSEVGDLQRRQGPISLHAVYHGTQDGIVVRQLLPPLRQLGHREMDLRHPPLLSLAPKQFLLELVDHYLFAALHEMLYASLMAESQQRVSHLDAALRHLDDQAADLARRSNALRQEEIIEEIEVILLSAGGLEPGSPRRLQGHAGPPRGGRDSVG